MAKKRKIRIVICKVCKRPFETISPRQKYCGHGCKSMARTMRQIIYKLRKNQKEIEALVEFKLG